jgi:hypothetical protein
MNKAEIDIVIGILKSIITLVEVVDPQAAQNKVVIEVQNVINTLQALGL